MTNLNEDIISIWKKFDHVKISCSIDDLEERNEYIRYPTKWEDVIRNFLRLKEENFEIDIMQTVSFMNYSNLDNFYNFFHHKHQVWVHHNFVYDPDFLSPKVLPKNVRDEIHDKLSNTLPSWKITELKSMFNNETLEDQWNKAVKYTKALDNIRKQNIIDYLPEFKKLV